MVILYHIPYIPILTIINHGYSHIIYGDFRFCKSPFWWIKTPQGAPPSRWEQNHQKRLRPSRRCREVNQLASTKLSRWVCSRKLREVLMTWAEKDGYPLVMTNRAIENTTFIVDLPIENGGSFHSFLLNYQRVYFYRLIPRNHRKHRDVQSSEFTWWMNYGFGVPYDYNHSLIILYSLINYWWNYICLPGDTTW